MIRIDIRLFILAGSFPYAALPAKADETWRYEHCYHELDGETGIFSLFSFCLFIGRFNSRWWGFATEADVVPFSYSTRGEHTQHGCSLGAAGCACHPRQVQLDILRRLIM